jgi:uncharacterized protein YqhQ
MNNPDNIQYKDVGGQAVIEGVMMRAPKSLVIAVRKPNQEIVVRHEQLTPLKEKYPLLKIPVLRGIAVLIESLIWGMKSLTYSADQAVETINENDGKPAKGIGNFALFITILLSFVLGIGLFVIIPERLANIVSDRGIVFNIVDGVIRLAIFFIYVLVVSRSKQIARVFQYHGAEHKSIHAYEAGDELTVENVLKYSPLHPRCGTAFLMTVMIIGIITFSLFGKPDSVLIRIGSRLVLMPIIAGISYEIIKFSSKRQNSRFVRTMALPGLWMQRLTTKEPSEDQIQVAIKSLEEVLAMEKLKQV